MAASTVIQATPTSRRQCGRRCIVSYRCRRSRLIPPRIDVSLAVRKSDDPAQFEHPPRSNLSALSPILIILLIKIDHAWSPPDLSSDLDQVELNQGGCRSPPRGLRQPGYLFR